MYLSVIVPAYNEEKTLNKNINKYNDYLSKQNYDYEIIIVNDGSSDNTVEISKNLMAKNPKIELINNKINRGKGYAVRQGLLAANGKYMLFIDADNATSIEHVEKTWPKFKDGYDIVIGSRSPKDIEKTQQVLPQPIWKRFMGVCGNILIQTIAIKGIWDTQCGFKILTNEVVNKIIPRTTINRWGFDVEILALAKIYNFKIAIIPVRWINSPNSRVGISGYFSSLKDIIKIKINLARGKYNN